MAYREFYDRADEQTPDYSPIARGLTTLFGAIGQGYRQRKNSIDQYKYALDYGKFENDNNFNTQYSQMITRAGKNDLRQSGSLSQNVIDGEQQGLQYVADQKAQYERFTKLNEQIDKRGTEDPYYIPEADKKLLETAAFGEDGEVDFRTRGGRLEQAAQMVGNDPRSFKFKNYTADWTKLYGEKDKARTTNNPDAKNAIQNKARFWDPATGKPGVTDNHAIDFLKSEKRVDRHYDHQLNQQLTQEIQQMKASGEPANDWMKDLTDAEIKSELINNPSKNQINKQEYGMRKRELAKKDLADADAVFSKVDYEKKADDRATHGLYRNDAISYSPTFYQTQTGNQGTSSAVSDATGTNQLSAPGGLLIISKGLTTGKPISINVEGRNAYNINSGKQAQITGRQPFNLTGYQLQVYDKSGNPYKMQANDMGELTKKIQSMRPFEFKNLAPEPSVALNGYALDKNTILGDLAKSSFDLNSELGEAIKNGNETEAANIQSRIDMIDEFKRSLNDPDNFSDQDILNLAAKNGITQTRQDQLVKASGSDLDWINNVTQGLNLKDKSKWSQEMITFDQAYRDAYNKAAAQGFGDSPSEKFDQAVKNPVKKATTPKATTQPSSKIRVKAPDGRFGFMTQEQFDKAVGDGLQLEIVK